MSESNGQMQPAQPPVMPQQPVWTAPPTQIVDSEPLEYHRLLRGIRRYRWWKPLLLLIVSGAIYGILNILISGIWLGVLVFQNPDMFNATDADVLTEQLMDELMLDTQNPLSVLMNLLAVILMIPAVLLGMLAVGIRPLGRIWSVAARIRWGLVWRSFGIAVVTIIATNVVGVLIEIAMDPGSLTEGADAPEMPSIDVNAALVSLVLVVLLVPLQATAEEVVFRGVFMQVLGAWLKNPWFAIVIPSVAFALAHIYDVWGMIVVGLMGLAAAWLTWRTGGLEAAIAIHIVNNLFAFAILATGLTGETGQTEDGGGVASAIAQAVGLALFVWLVTRSFRKHGYGRQRIDRVEVPLAVSPAGPAQAPEVRPYA